MRILLIMMLWVCCVVLTGAAQNALVELNFEEAEKAYNAQNYTLALSKLDQVEQAVGTSSKTLYLRIHAQDKLIQRGKHDEGKSALIENLRINVQNYLDVMAEYGLDEKYRDVYAIQEKYKNYDGTAISLISKQYAVDSNYILPDYFLDSTDVFDESRFYQRYPNGKLIAKGEYQAGQPIGNWEWRDEADGRLWRSATFGPNGTVTINEWTKGSFSVERSAVGVLSTVATTLEVRSAFGIGSKKRNANKTKDKDLSQQLSQLAQDHLGNDQDDNMQWSFQMNGQRYYGRASYTENGQKTATKNWYEKRGHQIQEIYLYKEDEKIDYMILLIDDTPVMRVPYDSGFMVPEAKAEYTTILNSL